MENLIINAGKKYEDIKKAVAKASQLRDEYDEIKIVLENGEYEFGKTLEITNETLKKGRARIIITSEGKAAFSGGKAVDPLSLKKVTDEDKYGRIKPEAADKILCTDLKKFGVMEFGKRRTRGSVYDILPAEIELFVDDEEAKRTFFPKNGKRMKIKKENLVRNIKLDGYFPKTDDPYGEDVRDPNTYPIMKYDYPEGDRWANAKDAFLFGPLNSGFFDVTVPVKCFDTEKREIHTDDAFGFSTGRYFNTYSVCNLLEELDTPGEYYIDSETLILYYYPKREITKDTKLRISYLKEPLIALEDADDVIIENIIFENTRGMGVYWEGCRNTQIRNCVFRNIGMVAVSFGIGYEDVVNNVHDGDLRLKKRKIGGLKAQTHNNPMTYRNGGYNNTLSGCEIYNIGCGGVILDGGNREKLYRGNNRVTDCDIHDYNRLETSYRPGVHVFGCGNTVSFCRIYNSPQMAIELTGNDNTVEYCEIFNCCTDSNDSGAIYCGSRFSSRNTFGTVFRGNYFHDNGSEKCDLNEGAKGFRSETYDLYLDGHSGTEICENVFEGSAVNEAVFVNICAFYDKVIGNIFIDVNAIFHREFSIDYSYDAYSFFGFDEETANKWRKKYPLMENYKNMREIPCGGHSIRDNIHIGKGYFIRSAFSVYDYENNVHYAEMPQRLERIKEKIKKR